MRFIFFFLLLSYSVLAQKPVQDTVNYRNYNTLKWTDFKADVPENTTFSASVSTGMSYKWSYSTRGGIIDFRYDIHAKLYRNFSWSIYDKEKESVLKHEQYHFEITELFARKFRKALAEYEIGRSIRNDVTRIYENLENERKAMQLLYDEETEHSINKEAQLSWESKIELLLKQYEAFK